MTGGARSEPRPRPGTGAVPAGTRGVSRLVIGTSLSGTILLALGAFWLSFTALRDLAVLAGIPADQAWVWPLIVDGVILEATISVVALRDKVAAARRFAWLLLSAGAAVSVAANITHAVVAASSRVPSLIAALVASVPPLVLLAMTHLTVELLRNADPVTAATAETNTIGHDPHAADLDKVPPAGAVAVGPQPVQPPRRARSDGRAKARALELAATHMSQRQIAAELGVHPTTIGRWLAAPDHPADQGDAR